MSRSDALAAYEKLPIPDTTEEHWRFTNLRDFDPEAFAGAASAEIETMLDLDVAGYATVTADGIEIEKAPEGVTFEPLPEEHERLYSLVGWDEKFAAHNAAMWKHGLLVVVPKGVELETKGITFEFDESPFDTGVCHMAIFKDPDGNQLMLHRRYAPHES